MEEPAPFIPRGRDTDYFPKANDNDEELKVIINDKKMAEKQKVESFNKFDMVNYPTLQNINAKEAKKAMERVQRKKKSEKRTVSRYFFSETILQDLCKGKSTIEDLVQDQPEEPMSA